MIFTIRSDKGVLQCSYIHVYVCKTYRKLMFMYINYFNAYNAMMV